MRSFSRWKKLTGLCICGLTACLLCGCVQQEEEDTLVVVEESNETKVFDFVTAEIGDVVLTQKLRCTYRQQDAQDVSFDVTGRIITRVYVKEGDTVKAGDLLAELSAGNLERQIEDLEYKIARNQILLTHMEMNEALDRSQEWVNYLFNKRYDKEGMEEVLKSITQRYQYQRQDVEDNLDLDEWTLENMKQEYEYCRIYAGMNGVIYKLKNQLEGSTSKEDEVIMTIVDNSKCLFETEEVQFAEYFQKDEPVEMTINVGNSAGQYVLLPYNIAGWKDKLQFSVFDGPATSSLEVGTSGMIRFELESKEQVLCLPKMSVYEAEDKHYVYVVGEDDMREIRWVEVGVIGDDMVEITGGLKEGEKVIRK